jgi:hypothetical protein
MEVMCSSETSVGFHPTMLRDIPEEKKKIYILEFQINWVELHYKWPSYKY